MAKFTLTHAVVVLTLLFTVVSMVTEIQGKRTGCILDVLDPRNCEINDCKNKCFQKHKSRDGRCLVNGGSPAEPTYMCVCLYDRKN
ncbi:hypothetical protein V6N13_064633 [Hibiscus sabdariffa]|uniref:Uncharacterized protein n=1 Tax=Hibiscus sabdariffa TaxID=183260 RepID=A0ABR2EAM7_9ROSI